ncbi:MAG: hypothetical protein R2758_15870 [Bacteroidales bacterium]
MRETSTLSQSDRQEAMRVMTIHKAKGLQSKVVIVPFCSMGFSRPGFSRPLLWVTDVPAPLNPCLSFCLRSAAEAGGVTLL